MTGVALLGLSVWHGLLVGRAGTGHRSGGVTTDAVADPEASPIEDDPRGSQPASTLARRQAGQRQHFALVTAAT